MKSKIPTNLHIVPEREPSTLESAIIVLGRCKWLTDPSAWNKDEFLEEIEKAMRESHGETVELDRYLISMLCSQVEIYVKCWYEIEAKGLTTTYNAGKTPGSNPCVAIADRALKQVLNLLNELGVIPKNRRAAKTQGQYAKLLSGP